MKYKIKKRYPNINPLNSLPAFSILLFFYALEKGANMIVRYEWLWWIAILLMFVLWFFRSYKITKESVN